MTEPKSEEFGISAVAIDTIEREFVEVMKELSAEDNLERFRLEYEKLHRALKKSHESEKRLIKKCQELNQEIMSNAAKVQSALKLSQDDEATIVSLRKEIEKAWKMVDSAHEKEARAKDSIQELHKEVNRLQSLVEQGAGLTLGQETTLQDLVEERKEYTKDRDQLLHKHTQQAHELSDIQEKVKRIESELSNKEAELAAKTTTYQQLNKEFETEQHRKHTSESKVQELHKAIEKRTKEAESAKDSLKRKTEDIEKLDKVLKEERDMVHELLLKSEKVQREVSAQNEQLSLLDAQNLQFKKDIPRLKLQLEQRESEVAALQATKAKLQKAVAAQERDIKQLEVERDAESAKTSGYEKKIKEITADLEKRRRELEESERKVKDQVRDKNLTISKAVREEGIRVKLEGERVIEQGKNRSLEQERDAHEKENHRLRKARYELEKQRRKYEAVAVEAEQRHNHALEEVRAGKTKLLQLQHELEDAEKKLKNQQSMYEQVRSERALYKKNLNEAQEEIEEMERKFTLMDHQIEQLKDDLSRKENELCKAHAKHKALSDEYTKFDKRVQKLRESYKGAKGRAAALADEIKQLAQIIADCDTEKSKQQMKFNSVTNERNILATQLIRRNEELSVLYEKIKLQRSTLGKGEAQYRERLVDIRLLRQKVYELRGALRVSLTRIRSVEELKRQITTLQRQLIHERTKVKALYEELQNPMNVHRWRKLEGSDPQVYENILKVQTLQRRLIAKTEEARRKDALIQEKEKMYVDLKNILSRQPGPEIAEQLSVYEENLRTRKQQMSKMNAELESSNVQVTEYRSEVERLHQELLEMKKNFFTMKSKNQTLAREKQLRGSSYKVDDGANFVVHYPASQPRFAGGGFSLSQ